MRRTPRKTAEACSKNAQIQEEGENAMTQPNEKDRERARGVALELNMCCSNLEAELKKAEGAIRTHADSINVLMKEKAGLEERVRELEGDKNILELQVSAKRETWESQTVDRLEKKLEYYQSQFNHYHTLAEKVTLENERLKVCNAELERKLKIEKGGVSE